MKRVLTIATAVILLCAIGFGAYYLFFRKTSQVPGGGVNTGTLPTPGSGSVSYGEPLETSLPPAEGVLALVGQNLVASFFGEPNGAATIVQPDGVVARVENGQSMILSGSATLDLARASFSRDGKKILETIGKPVALQTSVFDVGTKAWRPLASLTTIPAWAPTGYQIAYFIDRSGKKALETLDLGNDKAKPKELTRLAEEDLSLAWVSQGKIFFTEKPSAYFAAPVWSFDTIKTTFAKILAEERGLVMNWNGDGAIGLIFKTDASRRGGSLSLINAAGEALQDLSFLTLPEKCALQSQDITKKPQTTTSSPEISATNTPSGLQGFLYCAVPRDQAGFKREILPDAYYKRSIFTEDDFYKIDLTSGNAQLIFKGPESQAIDAEKLSIGGNKLFFVNRYDQKLYTISF